METTADSINELSGLWTLLFPNVEIPAQSQWIVWLCRYEKPIVKQALGALGMKYLQAQGQMTYEHLVRFGSSVMSRLLIESQARQNAQFHRTVQQ